MGGHLSTKEWASCIRASSIRKRAVESVQGVSQVSPPPCALLCQADRHTDRDARGLSLVLRCVRSPGGQAVESVQGALQVDMRGQLRAWRPGLGARVCNTHLEGKSINLDWPWPSSLAVSDGANRQVITPVSHCYSSTVINGQVNGQSHCSRNLHCQHSNGRVWPHSLAVCALLTTRSAPCSRSRT